MTPNEPARTLVEKIWDEHVVAEDPGAPGDPCRRPPPRPRGHQPPGVHRAARPRGSRCVVRSETVATADHSDRRPPRAACRSSTCMAAAQVRQLETNCARVRHPAPRHRRPEPGHRPRHRPGAGPDPAGHDDRVRRLAHRTHGAFGALAFGIGTSEVEMVLATQTLLQRKPKTYEVRVDGTPRRRASAPRTSSSP